jgi:hypothetical protein
MDQDPAVKEGILVYEAYPCRSFPGDSCLRRISRMRKAAWICR